MFSNNPIFLSSRNVSDQVSHPYKSTDKIIFLYILIFKFLDSNLEDKRDYSSISAENSWLTMAMQFLRLLPTKYDKEFPKEIKL